MEKLKSLDELAEIITEENDEEILTTDKSMYRNKSKKIALTFAYLLGVNEKYFEIIDDNEEERNNLLETISKNRNATAIRALNNIRSNLMLRFKEVSQLIRVTAANYTPIYNIEYFKEDFRILSRQEINIGTGRSDINEYLRIINTEINRRIDSLKPLFPDWVDFRHIKYMFNMPNDTENESKRFQANQNCYPYKRYFYWIYPEEIGNILATDEKILSVVYYNDGDAFQDQSRVIDASDNVKNNISDFINRGSKIHVFIDGENADPYCFASAMDSLKEHQIDKIDKIVVYYDEMFSSRAWLLLKHFTYGVEVEAVPVSRIKEDKSLVDHKLVAGISKAFYRDNVDSFILVSSDSDFWAVMEDVEANYLVMIEKEKCSYDFKEILRDNEIFYCYLDSFQTPEDDMFFKTVFRKELENVIENGFHLGSARNLLDSALEQSRAHISEGEYENIFNKYIKDLRLTINKEGMFEIVIPG